MRVQVLAEGSSAQSQKAVSPMIRLALPFQIRERRIDRPATHRLRSNLRDHTSESCSWQANGQPWDHHHRRILVQKLRLRCSQCLVRLVLSWFLNLQCLIFLILCKVAQQQLHEETNQNSVQWWYLRQLNDTQSSWRVSR